MKNNCLQLRKDIKTAASSLVMFVLLVLCTASSSHAQQALKLTSKPSDSAASKSEQTKVARIEDNSSAEDLSEAERPWDGDTKPMNDVAEPQQTPSPEPQKQSSTPEWHYGGFVDVGFLLDFNHPSNRVFRSRGTTWHVDRPQINMAAFYLSQTSAVTNSYVNWARRMFLILRP